jgi:DNA-binding CsgD family transcriptional regulator
MRSTLAIDRARGDLDVLSRAGLDLEEFVAEAVQTVQRAVPWQGACVGTHDPVTMMLTSGRKFGDLTDHDSLDGLFSIIEYGSEERSTFQALAASTERAIGMHTSMPDYVDQSERLNRLVRPHFGYADEARLAFRDQLGMWGGMALFRAADDPWFDEDEIAFLASLSDAMARGVRAGMLTRLADPRLPDAEASGPAVIIVDADDEVTHISLGAEERLAQLKAFEHSTDPLGTVFALVTAARRMRRSETDAALPHARLRTASGVWLVVHAAPLATRDGISGQVVVTIEQARPPEIIELVVAAFGLTARERDVTRLVLQGVETKQIAETMHVSTYTVQDHLKSVFDKAGVRSRRELISRVYFDQYVPRLGSALGPSGWFSG